MTYVYRMFDSHGDLLYVGITNQLGGRIGNHAAKPWFKDVAGIRIERYSAREEAARAEADCIDRYQPPHNISGKIAGKDSRLCSVEHCDRERKSRGMCGAHYLRARDRGQLPKTWERG